MQLPLCPISRRSSRIVDEEIRSGASIIWMLRTIATESAAIHANGHSSQAAQAVERSIKKLIVASHPSHSRDLLMSRIVTLQSAVTRFDKEIAGGEFGSLAELGLRAQTLAILLLLDELCEATQYGDVRYQALFEGRLRTMDEVASLLFDSLARINKQWLRSRTNPHALWAPYHLAIRQAQQAITELGADPGLVHFLRAGSSRTDTPRLRYACDQLASVFNITLTNEMDLAQTLSVARPEIKGPRPVRPDDDATSQFFTVQQ